MTARKKIALFDLDHTLIPIDSDFEWGEFTIGLGWCDGAEFKRRNGEFFDQYRAGTLNVQDYVRLPPRPYVNKALSNQELLTPSSWPMWCKRTLNLKRMPCCRATARPVTSW